MGLPEQRAGFVPAAQLHEGLAQVAQGLADPAVARRKLAPEVAEGRLKEAAKQAWPRAKPSQRPEGSQGMRRIALADLG